MKKYKSKYLKRPETLDNQVNSDTFVKNHSERLIGVEIECYVPVIYDDGRRYKCKELLRRNGFEEWSVCYDSSLDQGGIEFNSPPMNGDRLFSELQRLLSLLRRKRFEIDKTCGLHIHVDARDLDYTHLCHIYEIASASEEFFMHYVIRDFAEMDAWCSRLVNTDRIYESNFLFDNFSRYYWVTLCSVPTHGTVEFRLHEGTLNTNDVKKWILMCVALVEAGIKGKNIDQAETWSLEKTIRELKISFLRQHIVKRLVNTHSVMELKSESEFFGRLSERIPKYAKK